MNGMAGLVILRAISLLMAEQVIHFMTFLMNGKMKVASTAMHLARKKFLVQGQLKR